MHTPSKQTPWPLQGVPTPLPMNDPGQGVVHAPALVLRRTSPWYRGWHRSQADPEKAPVTAVSDALSGSPTQIHVPLPPSHRPRVRTPHGWLPNVALRPHNASRPFAKLAVAQARIFGAPDLPMVVIEHPLGGLADAEIRERAHHAVGQVMDLIERMRA